MVLHLLKRELSSPLNSRRRRSAARTRSAWHRTPAVTTSTQIDQILSQFHCELVRKVLTTYSQSIGRGHHAEACSHATVLVRSYDCARSIRSTILLTSSIGNDLSAGKTGSTRQ